MNFKYVCSNPDCHPVKHPDERCFYALSEDAEEQWKRGLHPGCPRCGWELKLVSDAK